MKKLALLLVVFAIGTMSTYANNLDSKKLTKELRNEINQMLDKPNFQIEDDVTVTIKFTFSSEGEMVVLCPGCKNVEMKKYISSKLNYKKFNNPGEQNKIYKMPLTFKAS